METKKFSLKDITVLKESDTFANDDLINILGGNAGWGCKCKCGNNSAPLNGGDNPIEQN